MSTNNPMTQEELDAIQERVDGVTGGPWGCYGDGAHEVFDAGEYSDGDRGEVVAAVIEKLRDAEFIAHARTDIPALLAEVGRLRAQRTVTEDMVERAAREIYRPERWDEVRHSAFMKPGEIRAILEGPRARARRVLDAALNPEGS